jgi:hypothetical protein
LYEYLIPGVGGLLCCAGTFLLALTESPLLFGYDDGLVIYGDTFFTPVEPRRYDGGDMDREIAFQRDLLCTFFLSHTFKIIDLPVQYMQIC